MSSLRLAAVFLRIGALAFGGLGATLALIERELVDRHHAITRDDIAAALTHTKLLPGSTVMFRLTAQVVRTPLTRALAIGAFTIVALLPTASPWVVLSAGVIGLVVYRDDR